MTASRVGLFDDDPDLAYLLRACEPAPALSGGTLAEQLPALRKQFPIPIVRHVDSRDPYAALLLRSNYEEHRLCKTITKETDAEGKVVIEGADAVRFFSADVIHAPNIDALERILLPALCRPDRLVVMAALKDGANRNKFRRLIRDDRSDSEYGIAALADVPRSFWPLDVENFDAPDSLDLLDVRAVAEYARTLLPREFHAAGCIATASAKHGLQGWGARLRMWFYFDRPISAEFLKRWLEAAQAPVDVGALHASQPVYTARPLVERGAVNPLRGIMQWARLRGRVVEAIDEKTLARFAPYYAAAARAAQARVARSRATNIARAGEGRWARIAAGMRVRQAREGERHAAILRESFFLGGLVNVHAITEDEARQTLLDAGRIIGKSEDEVNRCFDYAIGKIEFDAVRWLEGGDR